ncbi:lysozyme inhibitor LprI family protein [Pseudoxanthomonas wuyuanensis]|uniref:Lysozyme inhibitor LprI N-terminal domain-containing protein n=1 Tax=Pseudoxanthomonas wuyuanensis TaxID=1073196 RepID=A0A286D9M9_9GAMM|nr:hypothetical protein [Pseudoxanthomonas wuyuanensis]SOD55366.1 hypothetical protein SAMN06296416_10744 [Pseudoxanthomonas wuyuanensis]
MRTAIMMGLACALAGLPALALAAGFDCGKARTATERAICADAATGALDAALAARWREALARSRYPAELKTDQLQWLAERNQCRDDAACLRRSYTRRLAELAPAAVEGVFDWSGEWTRIGGHSSPSALSIERLDADRYRIGLDASAGANMGGYSGDAQLDGDTLRLQGGDDSDPDCRMLLRRVHRQIELEQSQGHCGAGAGVHYAGRYIADAGGGAAPVWNLLNLGIVATPAHDKALRDLLGQDDYAALVARIDLGSALADEDGFGATVGDYAVRGIANNTRGLLMQTGDGRLWVALLDFDSQGKSEVRYYSNVPGWTGKLPRTAVAWLESIRGSVPLRMMSEPDYR